MVRAPRRAASSVQFRSISITCPRTISSIMAVVSVDTSPGSPETYIICWISWRYFCCLSAILDGWRRGWDLQRWCAEGWWKMRCSLMPIQEG
ncbi:hypothetical protein F5B21DRAFT_492263 [Xylaria acuta]|nr:hypothetical protein F5B21DRAFT_492263 [Xylaria acuta]